MYGFPIKRQGYTKALHIDNGIKIEYVESFNFLGLTLNNCLSWKNHIEMISLKISRTIGILNKLKHYFPQRILQTIYNTLLVPRFNYCLLTWGSDTSKINMLQKRALRVITCSNYIDHTEPICKNLKLLKIGDMYTLRILKFYYDMANGRLPDYFANLQPLFSQGNSVYNFRNPQLQLPCIRHEFAKASIRYMLIHVLNDTPSSITAKVFTHSMVIQIM
jgi:hypothetical protein